MRSIRYPKQCNTPTPKRDPTCPNSSSSSFFVFAVQKLVQRSPPLRFFLPSSSRVSCLGYHELTFAWSPSVPSSEPRGPYSCNNRRRPPQFSYLPFFQVSPQIFQEVFSKNLIDAIRTTFFLSTLIRQSQNNFAFTPLFPRGVPHNYSGHFGGNTCRRTHALAHAYKRLRAKARHGV